MENNNAGLTPPVSKQEDRYDKFKRAEELVKLGEKSSDARKRRKAIAYYKEAAAIFKEIDGEKSIKLASVSWDYNRIGHPLGYFDIAGARDVYHCYG